jgi:two-component system, sporulation sensor kinase D
MQWTDRIRQVKIFLVAAAVIIAVASLLVSNALTRDLKTQERNKMAIWAEAMRSLNRADENTDLNLVLKVIDTNDLIPIVVLDNHGNVETCRNIRISASCQADSLAYLADMARYMKSRGNSIRIVIDEEHPNDEYIDVCFDDSLMLKRLVAYPYVQLGVVLIFVVVAVFALLTSKKAEQNKVWVGLSKETAHQLGTPISSLMAWMEVMKETYPDDELIPEMSKDVDRLQLIADRFSKIGSLPEPVPSDLTAMMTHVTEYMDRRTSSRVTIECRMPDYPVIVKLNVSLFEWVIENLCKNAVDAMEGTGSIVISVDDSAETVAIEVADTGKGIARKDLQSVFRPGFTTKKRGWGLGLSLAKRIVEEYHKGRIWVKKSEIGKGTTFRIELKK